jgi:hypothetical protein
MKMTMNINAETTADDKYCASEATCHSVNPKVGEDTVTTRERKVVLLRVVADAWKFDLHGN